MKALKGLKFENKEFKLFFSLRPGTGWEGLSSVGQLQADNFIKKGALNRYRLPKNTSERLVVFFNVGFELIFCPLNNLSFVN